MERTPKQLATQISQTCKMALKAINGAPVLSRYGFLDLKEFYKSGADKIITDLCKQRDLDKANIVRIIDLPSQYIIKP